MRKITTLFLSFSLFLLFSSFSTNHNATSLNEEGHVELDEARNAMMGIFISATNLDLCDGQLLDITVSGLPTTGVDRFQINYSIGGASFSHTTPSMATLGSGSYTFTTVYVADLADVGDLIDILVSIQDPFGTPINLAVDPSLYSHTIGYRSIT